MNGFNNFIELLVKGDFFLIFLIVIMIVIISVIIYLIKLQINEKLYNEEEEDIPTIIDNTIKEERKPIIEQTKVDFNPIKDYETEQEEMAIIRLDELDNRLKDMKDSGELDKRDEEIENYEMEQENKAIISYDELLKRATLNSVSYESQEDLGGVKIAKVDTSKLATIQEENNNPYYKEEAFLNALKEFRESL